MLGFALGDLATARANRANPDVPDRNAAYQAQQAAEKALKAVILLENKPFDWVHDVEVLAGQVPADFTVPLSSTELARLSDLVSSTHYPNPDEAIGDGDADEAITLAEAVVSATVSHFKSRGVDPGLYMSR